MTLSKASVAPPAATSMPPAARPHGLDLDAERTSPPAWRDALEQAREHRAIAAGHVAERLLLRRRVARREQALDVGPDEDGRHAPVVLAELGEQERLPQLLEGRAPGIAHQEFLDGHALEPLPVADARAIEDRRREPELAPEAEQRKAQEVEPAGERMDRAVDVEAGLRRAPAQPIRRGRCGGRTPRAPCRRAGSRGRSGPR